MSENASFSPPLSFWYSRLDGVLLDHLKTSLYELSVKTCVYVKLEVD